MLSRGLGEFHKLPHHKIRPRVIFGAASPYFMGQTHVFLEQVFQGFFRGLICEGGPNQVCFRSALAGWTKIPSLPPYIPLHSRHQNLYFDQIKSQPIAATSCTSFVSNDQTKTSQNPTLINKAFILYSQYPDCNLSFLLVLHLLAGNRPLWSG